MPQSSLLQQLVFGNPATNSYEQTTLKQLVSSDNFHFTSSDLSSTRELDKTLGVNPGLTPPVEVRRTRHEPDKERTPLLVLGGGG